MNSFWKFRPSLASFCASSALLRAYVGSSWACLGTLTPLFPHLGRPLPHLGSLLPHSWPSLARLGPVLAPLFTHLGSPWASFGSSWAALGSSWVSLGPLLGLSWPVLGCPGPLLADPGRKCFFRGGGRRSLNDVLPISLSLVSLSIY